jgi:AbrB family looped-hinge helix DNA binding protein
MPPYSASSKISSKGQITLPKEVRDSLGVGVGDRVQFLFDGQRTVVKPVRDEENPFLAFVGTAPSFSTVEESVAWVRDMRDDEYEAEETRKRLAASKETKQDKAA